MKFKTEKGVDNKQWKTRRSKWKQDDVIKTEMIKRLIKWSNIERNKKVSFHWQEMYIMMRTSKLEIKSISATGRVKESEERNNSEEERMKVSNNEMKESEEMI